MLSPREITPSSDPSKDKQKTSSLRSSTRVTRSTTSPPATDTSIRLSNTEIIKNSQSSIRNTESAKKWIYEREYILKGEELSIPSLTTALLSLASGQTNSISQLVNGIRVVAICLDSTLPEATNLEAIRDTIETAALEITTEATSILSNLAENTIKSISEIEAKCQELVLKAEEHVNSKDSATLPLMAFPSMTA
jgi:hypothetical protein